MFHNRNSSASFDASVQTEKALPVGMMARKTIYRVENFPPVDLPSLKSIIGSKLFAEHEEDFNEVLVQRDNKWQVPLGSVSHILGNKLTEQMRMVLYSRPLWIEEAPNLVVMAGLTDSIDKHFKGSSYTAAWYVGLVSGTPTFAEGNTMDSHAGWFEVAPYAGARPTLTLGTVVSGSVDNSANKAAYTINATMVVGGAFLVTLPTASQTSGTLYGGAAFTGGNRSVASGDTLNVTTTLSATAA